mmetsp:Transcript_8256/g.18503  ORF Transcript_8256/g.18503 Transcript_8256/m.18503 type:complete len:98 (-) Transcript_8256:308-601(-)
MAVHRGRGYVLTVLQCRVLGALLLFALFIIFYTNPSVTRIAKQYVDFYTTGATVARCPWLVVAVELNNPVLNMSIATSNSAKTATIVTLLNAQNAQG